MLRSVLIILIACWMGVSASAQSNRKIGAQLAEAITAIKADDWSTADSILRATGNQPAQIYFDWRRLRAGRGDWPEYGAFLSAHPDWPGLPMLRRVGEGRIPDRPDAANIIAYFADTAPQTGRGALALAQAYRTMGRADDITPLIETAFKTLPMSKSELAAFLSRHGKITRPLIPTRADHMVWESELSQASALLPHLDSGQGALIKARVALRRGQGKVNALIDAIPQKVANQSAGLRFDRFRWRMRRDLYDGAEELLRLSSASRAKLGRPDIWSRRRGDIAQRAMRQGRYKAAYEFARRHHLKPDESGFTELEWLAGYIALRYLNRAEDAVTHFRRLRGNAVTPITSGRVWYWLGRAHEQAGNAAKADEAYGLAARYQTSFYGQLGAERGKIPDDPAIAVSPNASWQTAPFLASTIFRAGLLLHYADEHYEAGRFFAHMAETMVEADQDRLGQFLVDLDRPNMALRVAKNAARLGRVTINAYYPITELAAMSDGVPPELVMAIARQETELNPSVVSPVGAQGLMQVMPRTARAEARKLGVAYSSERMLTDWRYNARFGISYLGGLLEQYDGSFVLAAAAYNAGPGRVSQWIKAHGDPRSSRVDTVDWIEKIPFRETRNYVQRVLESANVYRARLTGQADKMRIGADLARGS